MTLTTTDLEVHYIRVKMRDTTIMDNDDLMYAPINNYLNDFDEESFREFYWDTIPLSPHEIKKLEWNNQGFVKITQVLKHILEKKHNFKFRESCKDDLSSEICRIIITAQLLGAEYMTKNEDEENEKDKDIP